MDTSDRERVGGKIAPAHASEAGLRRWREDPPHEDPAHEPAHSDGRAVESRIARLFRKLPPAQVTPQRLARMQNRLADAVAPVARRRRYPLVWAVAAALVLLVGGVGVAEVGLGPAFMPGWMPSWFPPRALRPSPAASDESGSRSGWRRPQRKRDPGLTGLDQRRAPEPEPDRLAPNGPAPMVPPLAPAEAPRASVPPVLVPSRPDAPLVGRRRAEVPKGTTPGEPATEAALLEAAVARLRRDRDPDGALRALDGYDARFSNGRLHGEALRLRVDALLLVGRSDEALALLRRLSLTAGARDLELGLIRGELLAARGDCGRALADFNRVARAATPSWARRAAAGRRACEQHGGAPLDRANAVEHEPR